MKLRAKLMLGFGLVALVTITLGIVTLVIYTNVREDFSLLQEEVVPSMLSMLETDAAIKALLVEVGEVVETGDATHRDHAEEDIAHIQQYAAEHSALAARAGGEESETAQDMEARAARIVSGLEQVLAAVQTGESPEEIENILHQAHQEAEELGVIFDEHVAEHKIELAEAEQNVYQALEIGMLAIWIAIVVAVVLSIGVGMYFVNSFTKPIQVVTRSATQLAEQDLPRLVQALQAASAGDLTATYQLSPNLVEVKSRDEIGQMGQAFNGMNEALSVVGENFVTMLANLRNLIGQVQQSADQVASASQQLNASAEQAGMASQQVATTSQQVSEGTSRQTQAVTEATGSVEQVARAAEGIARGAQEQATGIQKMSDLINKMGQNIEAVAQTGQSLETIRNRTAVATEKVKEMSTRSKEIGRIVETIDDIADKTDMLALNAAVEAARAGEHGRGFAVVADQVRKLSEDSKSATRDIDDLIERVQQAVSEAIAAMENTASEVESGTKRIDEAVSELKEKSDEVLPTIETVSAVVEENSASTEEMAANAQEITNTMEGVASIAEENSAATEEVSASAEEMSAQVEEVVASAEELAALAEELQAATAQFRVNGTSEDQRKLTAHQTNTEVSTNGQPSEPVVVVVANNHQDD